MKKLLAFAFVMVLITALFIKANAQPKGQITVDTTEVATWFIGAVITAMCFLLYRLLTRIEEKQEKHSDKLEAHGLKLVESW